MASNGNTDRKYRVGKDGKEYEIIIESRVDYADNNLDFRVYLKEPDGRVANWTVTMGRKWKSEDEAIEFVKLQGYEFLDTCSTAKKVAEKVETQLDKEIRQRLGKKTPHEHALDVQEAQDVLNQRMQRAFMDGVDIAIRVEEPQIMSKASVHPKYAKIRVKAPEIFVECSTPLLPE